MYAGLNKKKLLIGDLKTTNGNQTEISDRCFTEHMENYPKISAKAGSSQGKEMGLFSGQVSHPISI